MLTQVKVDFLGWTNVSFHGWELEITILFLFGKDCTLFERLAKVALSLHVESTVLQEVLNVLVQLFLVSLNFIVFFLFNDVVLIKRFESVFSLCNWLFGCTVVGDLSLG